MQDASFYPDPLKFDGFRFVNEDLLRGASPLPSMSPQQKPSKLTDVNMTFHVWGTGRMACPGRFYAAAVMKVVLGQLIMHYDCQLVDKNAPRLLNWRSTILPKHNTLVEFTSVVDRNGI